MASPWGAGCKGGPQVLGAWWHWVEWQNQLVGPMVPPTPRVQGGLWLVLLQHKRLLGACCTAKSGAACWCEARLGGCAWLLGLACCLVYLAAAASSATPSLSGHDGNL